MTKMTSKKIKMHKILCISFSLWEKGQRVVSVPFAAAAQGMVHFMKTL